MLSVHGMVIIATDIIKEYATKGGMFLSFWVSSEIRNKQTARYPINLWVSNDSLEEARQKIKPGSVCEIIKGSINSPMNKINGDPTKDLIGVKLDVSWVDFRVLKVCVYYEGIPGITEEKNGN